MPKIPIILLTFFGLFFGFQSHALTFSDGTLIKASGPEVYVLEHGAKRWIINPDIFGKLFYRWEKIVLVSNEMLASFPPGNKLDNANNFPDGALVKSAKSPKVYASDQSKLRWILDPDVFNSNSFSWNNIIIVPDAAIANKKKGSDIKNGEFLLLPSTIITEKPPAEINFTKVTFRYSGFNPTGPVSELSWETFLEGYDTRWQPTSQYARTIDLPAADKPYKFYVRSRNKEGKVDARPASYYFKLIGFSPLYKKLKINSVKSRGGIEVDEYVKIRNNSKENINITGLVIKNRAGETAKISKGSRMLFLDYDNAEDIIIESGKSAVIFTGYSPLGKNFRLNKCTGYLNPYNFLLKLPEECPRPLDQDIVGLSKDCKDYIKNLRICAMADISAPKIKTDSQCQNYLTENFTYNGCFNNYRFDPDFLKNDWHVFLGKTHELWNNQHDEARLEDQNGGLIDSYSY